MTVIEKSKTHPIQDTTGDKIFHIINIALLALLALIVLYPLYFIVIASVSDPDAVLGGKVVLYPVQLTMSGFQWTDPSAPILNEEGAKALSCTVYSSKNASALDYNDMKIMQDLFAATNVFVSWENVSESVYGQQKNLIFGNADNRPDAIYHAGMSAGEIIKYAQRNVLLPISDYLQYMPNLSSILEKRPDIRSQLTSEDGKIYSLPRVEEMGLLQNPNLLFLNKNWAQAAVEAGAVEGVTVDALKDGLTLNADQMAAILTYFRDNDMNGDGAAVSAAVADGAAVFTIGSYPTEGGVWSVKANLALPGVTVEGAKSITTASR